MTPTNHLSLCQSCQCMTKTIEGKCGKCKVVKTDNHREQLRERTKRLFTPQNDEERLTFKVANIVNRIHESGNEPLDTAFVGEIKKLVTAEGDRRVLAVLERLDKISYADHSGATSEFVAQEKSRIGGEGEKE